MTVDINELVQDISGLVTLPDVYLRINRLIEDPRSTSSDIANVIGQDAALTIRLLRVANSSIYSFPSTVNTVAKAVTIIGTSRIRNLALSLTVADKFNVLLNDLVSMDNFWKHSLLCALAARNLGKQAGRCDPDALFTGGLLHDIGELILFNRFPELAKQAILMVLDSDEEISVHEAEVKLFGFHHADVGGALARQWNLPPLLEECIGYHHDLSKAKKHPRETALVHIANVLALMAEIDSLDFADVEPIDPQAWEMTGLNPDIVEPTVRGVQTEFKEVKGLFVTADE